MSATSHEFYMHRCLQLAGLGLGTVSPNPMVGALLLYQDQVIGEGYHAYFGGPHAEIDCLNRVLPQHRHLIRESTLYVSLEPCSHTGKTGPCSLRIIQEKIPRVVVACTDPNERVSGKGIEQLRQHGIEVITGILEKEARQLNRRFFINQLQKRPFVILKWAMSADGKIAAAGPAPVSISGPASARLVHRWRAEEDAILVGTQTVLTDDPMLTARYWPGKNPVRVCLDRNLRIPENSRIFDANAPVIVLNTIEQKNQANLSFRRILPEVWSVSSFLSALFAEGIGSVLVEGGAKTLQSFIDAGLWDEARVISSGQCLIPGGLPGPELNDAAESGFFQIQHDIFRFYTPKNSHG